MKAVSSNGIRIAKNVLRTELKKRLSGLGPEEKARQSQLVVEQLLQNQHFRGSHRISVYLCTDNEVQTNSILEYLFINGKEVFIPKYDQKSQTMEMVKLNSMEDYSNLPFTKWKIRQPLDDDDREEALSSGGLDLMLIPGLAFTKQGHRLGRGKGYYDVYYNRCLHDPHGCPYTIGLAFSEQILHNIPVEDHDFLLDEIIYPDA